MIRLIPQSFDNFGGWAVERIMMDEYDKIKTAWARPPTGANQGRKGGIACALASSDV